MVARRNLEDVEPNSEFIKINSDFKVEPTKFIVGSDNQVGDDFVILKGEGLPYIYKTVEYEVIFQVEKYSELGIVLDSLDRPDLVEEIEGEDYRYIVSFSELENLINSEIPMVISLVKTSIRSFRVMGYESWRCGED